MAIKENEQPVVKHGNVTETAINTFTAKQIDIPRILESRLLFDVDEIQLDVTLPLPTLGANAIAEATAQIQVSDLAPTALVNEDDPILLANLQLVGLADAADTLGFFHAKGRRFWLSESHANYVPDDKVWLCVKGATNKAGNTITAYTVMKGKLAKVTQQDFESLILSRLT